MKKLTAFLACSAALLPACSWDIGGCIRSSTALHVGGDTRKPVDGKVYYLTSENIADSAPWAGWRYAYVPEVTYRRAPDVASYWFFCWRPTDAFDVCPTGRTIPVRFKMGGGYYEVEKLDALPEGAVLMTENPYHHRYPDIAEIFGDFEDERATRGSLGAQILAAPFDYCLDPVLSVTTTPVFAVGAATFGGLIIEHGPAFLRWIGWGDAESGQSTTPATPAAGNAG